MSKHNVIGKPFRKVDARAKCVGQTKFADDIVLPRMLFCKILRSHVPHALIKNIDASKALAMPGVFAVITGKDLPVPYGILPVSQDEHALCMDKVRFVGDPVAAVAAIYQTRRARRFRKRCQAISAAALVTSKSMKQWSWRQPGCAASRMNFQQKASTAWTKICVICV